MPEARIKISAGGIEFEYEGDDAFITDGLLHTLEQLTKLDGLAVPKKAKLEDPGLPTKSKITNPSLGDISVSMIMSHLSLDSAQGLVLGAISKIQIVEGKDRAERAEILKEMQTATSYYDANARKNLSANLARLAKKKKINQLSEGNYALTAKERGELEAKISSID